MHVHIYIQGNARGFMVNGNLVVFIFFAFSIVMTNKLFTWVNISDLRNQSTMFKRRWKPCE